MKVTLIYAGITESGFNCAAGNEGTWISHGLCLIGAVLKSNGHQVDLMDLRRLKGWDDFAQRAKASDADIYGLTMMSCDYNPVMKCCQIIKEVKPGTPIMAGGPHPSIMPQELADDPRVDYVFVGEGEISVVELLKGLEEGRTGEKLIRGIPADLDSLPFADRSLFSIQEEPFVSFLEPPFVTLIAGRGCRYRCKYCMPAERMIFGKTVRRRSVANVIEELKALRDQFQFRSMMIHDDCLTEDREWVLDFCQSYKASGFTQPWVCQSRPDLICRNPDMVRAMKEAGVALMIIGMESGSDRILKLLKRGCKVEHNLKAAEICHQMEVKIWANYMFGLPTETREEARATVEMLRKVKPYRCSPAYYTPTPGSDLYDFCIKNNLSLIVDHTSYRRGLREPKIRGIDYAYLDKLLYESIALGEEQRAVARGMVKVLPASAIKVAKRILPAPIKRYIKRVLSRGPG